VQGKTIKGQTTVHLAVDNSDVEVLKLLVEMGVEEMAVDENLANCLHVAVSLENLDKVRHVKTKDSHQH
jgi:ankyrin repeat protein